MSPQALRQYIRFVNLEPGRHHLTLQCISRSNGTVIDSRELIIVIAQPWWNSWWMRTEDQVVAQFDLTEETPTPFEFTYTVANKAIIDERGGMLIVGFGYRLTKFTFAQ